MPLAAQTRSLLADKKSGWIVVFLLLFSTGVVFLLAGSLSPEGSLRRYLAHVIGGAIVGVAIVEVLHEWFIARRVREEFTILGACLNKGIEDVCESDEINGTEGPGIKDLRSTQSLSIQAIGASWLFRGEKRDEFTRLLRSKCPCRVLVPDPLSQEIASRYNDEGQRPGALRIAGLADKLVEWRDCKVQYPHIIVKVCQPYPTVNLTIYDKHIYVGPILYGLRGVETMTAIYRRPSPAAAVFEEAFQNLFEDEKQAVPIEKYDFKPLVVKYPHLSTRIPGAISTAPSTPVAM